MKYDYEPLIDDCFNYSYPSALEDYKNYFYSMSQNGEDPYDDPFFEDSEFDKLSLVFEKDYDLLVESESYFFGCSFDVYLRTYNDRLTSFLNDFPDAGEIDFCDYELEKKSKNYITSILLEQRLAFSIKKRIDFLNDKKAQLTNQPQQTETETPTTEPAPDNSLNWQGSELDFAELVKALLLTKKLNPELKEVEIFKRLKLFFNIKEFDHTDKIRNVKERTKGVPLFINILETALNNWAEK